MQQPETNDKKPANDKLIKNSSGRNHIIQLKKIEDLPFYPRSIYSTHALSAKQFSEKVVQYAFFFQMRSTQRKNYR